MSRYVDPVPQYMLDDGSLASSGKMKFFVNKDYSTLKATYSQSDNTIANTNPVTLDGSGRMPPCFGTGLYSVKFYAYDQSTIDGLGTLQWTRDDVTLSELTGQFSTWSSLLTYNSGDIAQGSDGNYYRSLINSNKANDPISSPTKWEQIVFFTIYNTSRTYNINDNVVNAGLLYRCNTNGTLNIAPPATQWDNLTFNGVVSGNLTVSGSVTAASYVGGNLSKTTDLGIVRVAVKQSVTSRNLTTTPTSDPDLIVTLPTTGDYLVRVHVNWSGNASTTNGIKFYLGFTTGLIRSFVAMNTIGTNGTTLESTVNGAVATPGNFIPTVASIYSQVITIDAVIRLDAGTTIFFAWAQQASGATATSVNSGSITATKLT